MELNGLVDCPRWPSAPTGWFDKFVMALTNQHWEETAQSVGWVLLFIGIGMLAYGARKASHRIQHDTWSLNQERFRANFARS